MTYLGLWLATGLAMFFLARAAWQLEFGCRPVTVGTLFGALAVMWVPPITFLLAATWVACWLFAENGRSFGRPIKRFFRTPLFNPCKRTATR